MGRLITILLVVVCVGLFGCGQTPLETINGNWTLALDSAAKKSSDPEEAALLAEVQNTMGEFKISVDARQKTLTINSPMGSETVNFSVKSEAKKNIILQAQGEQFSFEIKDADSVVLKSSLLGNQSVILTRVK